MAFEIGVWSSISSASASHSLGGPLLVSEGGSILVSAEEERAAENQAQRNDGKRDQKGPEPVPLEASRLLPAR
jgi:hypothetical protein